MSARQFFCALFAVVAAGITGGKRPHDLVTREEAAIMAIRSKE